MEFTIKPAKKKKHGKGAQSAKTICELTHCPRVPDHCTRWECHHQVNDAVQALENEKLALAVSVDGRNEEVKRLVAEIEQECDMEAFGSKPMSSAQTAFKASFGARPLIIACDCLDCKQKLGNLEIGVMAERLAVTQDWLAALREYRSKNDLEFLRGQAGHETEYVSRPHLLMYHANSSLSATSRGVNTFSRSELIEDMAHARSSLDCRCSTRTTFRHLPRMIWPIVQSSRHGPRGQCRSRRIPLFRAFKANALAWKMGEYLCTMVTT